VNTEGCTEANFACVALKPHQRHVTDHIKMFYAY